MNATAYIALGANLGDRLASLTGALARVEGLPGTSVARISPFCVTAPVGGPPGQPDYLNAAAELSTGLPPAELLSALLQIEQVMGRDRRIEVRHGPRIIDLDLLLYGQEILSLPGLELPHPRMHQRRFVLEPLAAIAPEVVHPVLKKTIRKLSDELCSAPLGAGTSQTRNSEAP